MTLGPLETISRCIGCPAPIGPCKNVSVHHVTLAGPRNLSDDVTAFMELHVRGRVVQFARQTRAGRKSRDNLSKT